MAPKGSNPLEDPPAASSSEDEEVPSSEEETDPEEIKDDATSGEEDDDEDLEPLTQKPSTDKPLSVVSAGKKNPNPEASESETESGSGSESEPERAERDLKPLATKQMPEYPRQNVVALPAKTAKRPAMEAGRDGKEMKRCKKTGQLRKSEEKDGKQPGEETKKQLFQRVFSEDDEIALLQGILEFTASKGDPYEDMDAFYEFVKKSLNFEASKAQLVDKIRRLRRKFENSVKKGKKGEDKVFSKAHDQKAFDLWKKIWGSEGALHSVPKFTAKSKKNHGSNAKAMPSMVKAEFFPSPEPKKMTKEGENKEIENNSVLANCTDEIISSREMVSILRNMHMGGLDDVTVMQGWDMVDGVKKKEVEERWKKLRAAQMELFVQNNEFMGEAAKLILEALQARRS